MDSLVQTIHFWHVMVELKINLFFITFMKDPSFPYLAVVTLVYLAAVRVKVTIRGSVLPWFCKENSLLLLFSMYVCVACVCTFNKL